MKAQPKLSEKRVREVLGVLKTRMAMSIPWVHGEDPSAQERLLEASTHPPNFSDYFLGATTPKLSQTMNKSLNLQLVLSKHPKLHLQEIFCLPIHAFYCGFIALDSCLV